VRWLEISVAANVLLVWLVWFVGYRK